MTIYDIIKNKNVIYNVVNCKCCLGTIARAKTIKDNIPKSNNTNIIITSKLPLEEKKKNYFKYDILCDINKYKNIIIDNKIDIIIHDLKVNDKLYNEGILLNIPQYLLFINDHKIVSLLNTYTEIKNIIIPYRKGMEKEFKNIKLNKIFCDPIVRNIDIDIDGKKRTLINTVKEIDILNRKYNIDKINNNCPVLLATFSTGNWEYAEKSFQYIYDNYNNTHNLIFIYGLLYKGKRFNNILSGSDHEPYLLELMNMCNLIVCHGAYSTLSEALSLNKDIIIIPRPGDGSKNYIKKFDKYYKNIKVVNI